MFYKNFTRHLPTLNQSGGLACGLSFEGKCLESGTGMWRQLHGSVLMKAGKTDEELLNLLEQGQALTVQRRTGSGFGEARQDQGRERSTHLRPWKLLPLFTAPHSCP